MYEEFFYKQGTTDGQGNAGHNQEVPVYSHALLIGRVNHLSSSLGKTISQSIRHTQNHISTEAAGNTGEGYKHTQDRAAANAHVNYSSQRRHNDKAGITGNVSIDANEQNRKGNNPGFCAAHNALHERNQEAALFGSSSTDNAHQNHAQRCKAGKVVNSLRIHLSEAVLRQQVNNSNCFAGAGMHSTHTHAAKYSRQNNNDNSKDNKQTYGVRQCIADSFDKVHPPIQCTFLFLNIFLHNNPP